MNVPPHSVAYRVRWGLGVLGVILLVTWIYQHYHHANGTAPAPQPHLLGGGGARAHGPFSMGDRIALGSYGVTVVSIEDPLRVQSSPFRMPPPRGKHYVLLRVVLTNLGSAKLPVDAVETVFLVDQLGRRYSASLMGAGGVNPPPTTSLKVHATQQGGLAFTLPDGARPVAAVFEPGDNMTLLQSPMPAYGHVRIRLGGG